MEINDVLTDPCPQCALKHLSAALAYELDPSRTTKLRGTCWTYIGVAFINYSEYWFGYESHLPYAIGMLARAEETGIAEQLVLGGIRELRLKIINNPRDTGVRDHFRGLLRDADMAGAHVYEAVRELPQLEANVFRPPDEPLTEWIPRAIQWVRENFFDDAQPAQTGGDTNGQG